MSKGAFILNTAAWKRMPVWLRIADPRYGHSRFLYEQVCVKWHVTENDSDWLTCTRGGGASTYVNINNSVPLRLLRGGVMCTGSRWGSVDPSLFDQLPVVCRKFASGNLILGNSLVWYFCHDIFHRGKFSRMFFFSIIKHMIRLDKSRLFRWLFFLLQPFSELLCDDVNTDVLTWWKNIPWWIFLRHNFMQLILSTTNSLPAKVSCGEHVARQKFPRLIFYIPYIVRW